MGSDFKTLIWKSDDVRSPFNESYFRLGNTVLDVPPANISVEKHTNPVTVGTMRATGDLTLKSGYSAVDITVSIPFFGEEQIASKLIPILAMFKSAPIVDMDNKFVRLQMFGTSRYKKYYTSTPFFYPNNPISVVLRGLELSIGDQSMAGIVIFATLKLSYYNHFPISPTFGIYPNSGMSILNKRIAAYGAKMAKKLTKFQEEYYLAKSKTTVGEDGPGIYSDQPDNEFSIFGFLYKAVENFQPDRTGTEFGLESIGQAAAEGMQSFATAVIDEEAASPGDIPTGGDVQSKLDALRGKSNSQMINPKSMNVRDMAGFEGLEPETAARMRLMADDYYSQTGQKMNIGSGFRTKAQQTATYNEACRKGNCSKAAKPGHSAHEGGNAIDLDKQGEGSPQAEYCATHGLLKKYGFYRPMYGETRLTNKPVEQWHIEVMATHGNSTNSNASRADYNTAVAYKRETDPSYIAKKRADWASKKPAGTTQQIMAPVPAPPPPKKTPEEAKDPIEQKKIEKQNQIRTEIINLIADGWEPDPYKSDNNYVIFKKPYFIPFYTGMEIEGKSPARKARLLVEGISLGYENKLVPIPIQSYALPFWQHIGGSSMWCNVRCTAIADPDLGECAPLSDLQTLYNVKEHQLIDLKSLIAFNPNYTEDVQSVQIWNPALNMLGLTKFIISKIGVGTNPNHIYTYDVELSMIENYMYAARVRGKTSALAMLETKIMPEQVKNALIKTPPTEIKNPEVKALREQLMAPIDLGFGQQAWDNSGFVMWAAKARSDYGASLINPITAIDNYVSSVKYIASGNTDSAYKKALDDLAVNSPYEIAATKISFIDMENLAQGALVPNVNGKVNYENPSTVQTAMDSVKVVTHSKGTGETRVVSLATLFSDPDYLSWPGKNMDIDEVNSGKEAIKVIVAELLAKKLNEYQNKFMDIYNKYAMTEPCLVAIKDGIKNGNLKGSDMWNEFFADGKILTPCYPDLFLDDLEDPGLYIDGVMETPPDVMADMFAKTKSVSKNLTNMILAHYALMKPFNDYQKDQAQARQIADRLGNDPISWTADKLGLPTWQGAVAEGIQDPAVNMPKIAAAKQVKNRIDSGQPATISEITAAACDVFGKVDGTCDEVTAERAVEQIYAQESNGAICGATKTQTYNRSFPTFRVYFVEDNEAFAGTVDTDSITRFKDWDQFFDYEAIVSIEVAKFKWDVDTAVIRVLNTFNELNTKMLEDGTERVQESNRDISDSAFDMKKYTTRLADGTLVAVDKHEDKLGYGDAKNHGTIISPLNRIAVQAGTKIMIKLGYSNNEYNLPVAFSGLVAKVEPGEVMTIICQGFLSELLEPVAGFVGKSTGGFLDRAMRFIGMEEGWSWSSIKQLFTQPFEWISRAAFKCTINGSNTHPIVYKLLGHPSVLHFGRWGYDGDVYGGVGLYAYGDAWRLDEGETNRCVENVDTLLQSNWQSKTHILRLHPLCETFWYDDPEEDAIWDVLREAVYRHPSHRMMVRPYGQSATLVVKELQDFYKVKPTAFTPYQGAPRAEMNVMREFLQQSGDKLLSKAFSSIGGGTGTVPVDKNKVNAYFGGNMEVDPVKGPNNREGVWKRLITECNSSKAPTTTHEEMLTICLAEGNFDCLKICLTEDVVSNIQEAYTQFKTSKMKDNPALAGQLHQGEFTRPVQRYFYASSYYNIVYNNIHTNDEIYNAVVVKNKEGEEEKGVEVCVDDNLDETYKRKFFFSSKNITKHYQSSKKISQDLQHLYGWSILIEKLNEMYQGELCILGEPDIMPYDCIMLDDSYNQIYGPVEVNSVIHRFSLDEGFLTFIEPHLCVRVDDLAFAVATGRTADIAKIESMNQYYYELNKHHNIDGPTQREKNVTTGGVHGTAVQMWRDLDRNIAGMFGKDDMARYKMGATLDGIGYAVEPLELLGISLDNIFFGASDTLYNSGPYRQPVIMTPLRFRNVPFVAGIRGAKYNSWLDSKVLNDARDAARYNNEMNGLDRGMRVMSGPAPCTVDSNGKILHNPYGTSR